MTPLEFPEQRVAAASVDDGATVVTGRLLWVRWPGTTTDVLVMPVDDAAGCMAEREAKLAAVRVAAAVMVDECAYLFERHSAEATEALQARGLDDALAYRALCAALAAAQERP